MENNNEQVVDTQATNENNVEEKVEVKTFTQDEVNEIIKGRLEKVKKGLPSEEEINKFNSWKESQKTEAEKQAEKEKTYLEKDERYSQIERENQALKSGVKIDEMDYVLFKVSKMDGEFKENLGTFLKENPKYATGDDEERVVRVGKEQGENKATPSNAKFEEMARRMGLDPEDL